MALAGEMTAVLQGMFDALDKSDPEVALASIGADAQGIDEISRRWMRGPGEVSRYVRELFGIAEDVHSEMHDVHEVDWGETGVVTFWLEQDYSLDGDRATRVRAHDRGDATRARGVEAGVVPLPATAAGTVDTGRSGKRVESLGRVDLPVVAVQGRAAELERLLPDQREPERPADAVGGRVRDGGEGVDRSPAAVRPGRAPGSRPPSVCPRPGLGTRAARPSRSR